MENGSKLAWTSDRDGNARFGARAGNQRWLELCAKLDGKRIQTVSQRERGAVPYRPARKANDVNAHS